MVNRIEGGVTGKATAKKPSGTQSYTSPAGTTNPTRPSLATRPSFAVAPAQPAASFGGPSGGGPGGGYVGGGGGGGDMGMMAAAANPSKEDFLGSDDVYLAALSRYNKQFDDLDADITRRRNDYTTTFDRSVRDLGRLDNGDWDFQNEQTAAGRGFQSLIQDFAARGLLHSGDYLRSQDDFKSSLGRQFTGMTDARTQFNEGLNSERAGGLTSRDAGTGQARAEALARYAQMYGAV